MENRLLQRDNTKPGWQLLLFTFTLEWPVSLVVSRRQLLQYQLLFKHLFVLKYVERQLTCVWADLQQARRLQK
jgi:gamma-tubulin complex component 2